MSVCFFKPHSALRKYIRHYVYCEIGVCDEWSQSSMAPHGCVKLCIALQRDQISVKENDKVARTYKSAVFVGQTTCFKHLAWYDRLKQFFVIFRSSGAFPLLGIHQKECQDICLNFDDLMGSSAKYLEERLVDQHRAEEVREVVECFFLQRIAGHTKKQERGMYQSSRLAEAVEQMRKSYPGRLSIKDLCRQTGYSLSTLERRMKKIVGMTPKQLQRIMRFNRTLEYINQNHIHLNWSRVAQLFGYYDQAHFIKEFKHFYGKTPAEYSTKDDHFLSDVVVANEFSAN